MANQLQLGLHCQLGLASNKQITVKTEAGNQLSASVFFFEIQKLFLGVKLTLVKKQNHVKTTQE